MSELTLDILIETYIKTKTLTSNAHLNWLKENVNPTLASLDPNLNINWGCQTCVMGYMNMLSGWWLREKDKKEIKIKSKPKKKKKPRMTVAKTLKVKNK
tara:strand:- start:391 stop:687 length:297 start_codon:yes stop_codon:yes gene_type:complete